MKIALIIFGVIIVLLFGAIMYSCCVVSGRWTRYEEMLKEQNLWIRSKNNGQGNENQDTGSTEKPIE